MNQRYNGVILNITLLSFVNSQRKMNPNKAKILHAASNLFLQGGTAALSVRAIANSAGVSTIGIYSHFEGKQGILDALYIEGFEYVIEAMDVAELGLSPREAVLKATSNYLDFSQTHKAHYRLIFGESDAGYSPSVQAKSVGVKAFAGLTAVAGEMLGETASQTSKQACSLQLWALIHGSVSLRNHAVAELVNMENWQSSVLQAVAILIDGLVKDN